MRSAGSERIAIGERRVANCILNSALALQSPFHEPQDVAYLVKLASAGPLIMPHRIIGDATMRPRTQNQLAAWYIKVTISQLPSMSAKTFLNRSTASYQHYTDDSTVHDMLRVLHLRNARAMCLSPPLCSKSIMMSAGHLCGGQFRYGKLPSRKLQRCRVNAVPGFLAVCT